MKRRRKASKDRSSAKGCSYIFFVCVSACTLLLFNGAIVGAIIAFYGPIQSLFENDMRFKQLTMLVVPVSLVLVEYWIFDFIADRLSSSRDAKDERSARTP